MTLSEVLALLMGVFLGAAFLLFLVRDYKKISSVEKVALWWWAAITVGALVGLPAQAHLLVGVDGVLMIGLGLFVALNVRGITERLGRRRLGLGPARWRFGGLVLLAIGALWALQLSSGF
jgi:hypothetical protein